MKKIKVSNTIYKKLRTNLLLQQTEVNKRLNHSQVIERLINKYEE